MSPVKYGLGFYIPEDDILHSHRHENVKSLDSSNICHPCCLVVGPPVTLFIACVHSVHFPSELTRPFPLITRSVPGPLTHAVPSYPGD
jgi:hypothetical protein